MDRRGFLGSSDIPAVLGCSPWKTPLGLWLEKTGREVPAMDEHKARLLRRGKRLEPVVLEMLAEERGLTILARNQRAVDRECNWMTAEIDAEVADEPSGARINIEVKTAHEFVARRWGEPDTDEIPVEYAAQAMWALMVTGRERTLFGVLIGSDQLLSFELRRDDDTIAAMRELGTRFWFDHVLADKPPPPKTQEDLSSLFRRDLSTIVQATPKMAKQARRYFALGAEVERMKRERDDLKFQLGLAMLAGGTPVEPVGMPKHVLVRDGKPLLQIAYREAHKLDVTRLREELPTVAQKYQRVSGYFEYRKARTI